MNDKEVRQLEMFKRVRNFGVTHQNIFAAGTLAFDLFDELGGVVTELEGYAAAQSTGRGTARQGTTSKSVARDAIMEDLEMLRRTARAMSFVMPGLEDKFRIPRNPSDEELLETARAFLAQAEPIKNEFIQREVPEHTFPGLQQNIGFFQNALDEQFTGRGESVAAVAAIDAAIEHGSNILRQLDPIARNKLHNDPATLAAWLSAKRVERAPRRNHNSTPPAPETPQQ
jgi:hypothetical protein